MPNLDTLNVEEGLNCPCPNCSGNECDKDGKCLDCNSENKSFIQFKKELIEALKTYNYAGLTPNIILLYLNYQRFNLPLLNEFLSKNNIGEKINMFTERIIEKFKRSEELNIGEDECLRVLIKSGQVKELYNAFITGALLNRNIISEKTFQEVVIKLVEDNIKELQDHYGQKDNSFTIQCIIKKLENDVVGNAYGISSVTLSDTEINNLYNGNLNCLLTIFHELYHIKQNLEIRAGIISDETLLNSKEQIIKEVLGYDYYRLNHDAINFEIDANINGYIGTLRYLKTLGLEIAPESKSQAISSINSFLEQRCQNRDVSQVEEIEGNIASIEDLFIMAINNEPSLLENYPPLKAFYIIDNNEVRAKNIDEFQQSLDSYTGNNREYLLNVLQLAQGVRRES